MHSMLSLFFLIKKLGVRCCLIVLLAKGFHAKIGWTCHGEKFVMLTPFKTSWELAIFQEWVPSFNGDNPKCMRSPTWITLRKLLAEFWSIGGEIMARLLTMLKFDKVTIQIAKQQFCVTLEARDGWETSLVVENEAMGEAMTMLIDFDFLPIRCKFCLKSFH